MLHILLVLKLLSTIATPAATSTGMPPAVTMATRSRRLTMMIGLRTQQLAGKCNWESCWETLLSLWQLRWHCLLSARISSVQSTLSYCSKLRDKFSVFSSAVAESLAFWDFGSRDIFGVWNWLVGDLGLWSRAPRGPAMIGDVSSTCVNVWINMITCTHTCICILCDIQMKISYVVLYSYIYIYIYIYI